MSNLFVTLDDFKAKLISLTHDVAKKLEESFPDSPKHVMADLLVNGKPIHWSELECKGLILSDNPLLIHCIEIDSSEEGNTITRKILGRIVVNVNKLVYDNDLGYSDTPLVFYTYRGYLRHLSNKFEEKYPEFKGNVKVRSIDKFGLLCLTPVIRSVLTKEGFEIPVTDNDTLEVFKYYTNLPEAVEKRIDELMCPLTVSGDDITVVGNDGIVSVKVDKKDFVWEHARTKDFDELITNF